MIEGGNNVSDLCSPVSVSFKLVLAGTKSDSKNLILEVVTFI